VGSGERITGPRYPALRVLVVRIGSCGRWPARAPSPGCFS